MKEKYKWLSTRYNLTLFNVNISTLREIISTIQNVNPARAELERALEVASEDGMNFDYKVEYQPDVSKTTGKQD